MALKKTNLVFRADGASNEAKARGLAAAQAVFDKAGVHALDAARAAFKREGWEMAGFAADCAPSDRELHHASIWDEADYAAMGAYQIEEEPAADDAYLELEIEGLEGSNEDVARPVSDVTDPWQPIGE